MRAPPRHLFRHRPRRADSFRVRDIWAVEPGDDRRFLALMRTLGADAQREIDRLPEEAGVVLLLLFFARYRGWQRVNAGGKVIDLTGNLPAWGRVIPEHLPEPLRRAWEAIAP